MIQAETQQEQSQSNVVDIIVDMISMHMPIPGAHVKTWIQQWRNEAISMETQLHSAHATIRRQECQIDMLLARLHDAEHRENIQQFWRQTYLEQCAAAEHDEHF